MANTKRCPRERRGQTLFLYYASPTTYGIRLYPLGATRCVRLTSPLTVPACPAATAKAISAVEYDELAGLRKAQAWGAPMFQPGHAKYVEALARLNELEAKEFAASNSGITNNQRAR